MSEIFIIVLFICIIFYGIVILPIKTKQKRKSIYSYPFDQNWITFLEKNIYLYYKLPNKYKDQLHNYIKIFLAEKEFIGKDGLNITEEMKLTVASQACLLLLDNNPNFLQPRRSNYFPYLKYIYIYPTTIEKKSHKNSSESHLLSGQSSVGHKSGKDGNILLSWTDVKYEYQSPNPRGNVVLHEFTHQLDQEFGHTTGTPRLTNLEETLILQTIFKSEYDRLCENVRKGYPTVIDKYGATNLVEFFAVATETFFVKPKLMMIHHSLLYEKLSNYYQLDPTM